MRGAATRHFEGDDPAGGAACHLKPPYREAGREAEGGGEEAEGGGIPDAYLDALDEAHVAYYEECEPSARRRVDATATPDAVCTAVLTAIDQLARSVQKKQEEADEPMVRTPSQPSQRPPVAKTVSSPLDLTDDERCESPPTSPVGAPSAASMGSLAALRRLLLRRIQCEATRRRLRRHGP